jgi:hypothetical protein
VTLDQRMPRFFALKAAAALRGVLAVSDTAFPARAGLRSPRAAARLPFDLAFGDRSG